MASPARWPSLSPTPAHFQRLSQPAPSLPHARPSTPARRPRRATPPLAPCAPDPTSQHSRNALPAADQPAPHVSHHPPAPVFRPRPPRVAASTAPPVSGSLFPFPSSPPRNRAPRSPARTPGSLSRCAPPRSPPGLFKRPSRTPPSTPIRRANPSRRLVTARSGAPPRPPPVSPCAASIQHPRRCSGPSNPRFASAADSAPGTRDQDAGSRPPSTSSRTQRRPRRRSTPSSPLRRLSLQSGAR